MAKPSAVAPRGVALSLRPLGASELAAGAPEGSRHADAAPTAAGARSYVLDVRNAALGKMLESAVPVLDRLLTEKSAAVREHKLEELVDFLTGQMVVPSEIDARMAQRLAQRHARVLNEFGHATAEQLADANQSRAANRSALADNWKKRRLVFSVRHRDAEGKAREVFPLFQFENHQPIKAVHGVIEAFGPGKAPWKLALWFTSNNGWLPGQVRPVDLLATDPNAVVRAAQLDAGGSAA